MGFALGNPGAALRQAAAVKPFRDALVLEIKAAGDNPRKLRKVARALLDQACEGNVPAIKEIADRLDGRVPQALIDADDGQQITLQVVKYVIEQPTLETHNLTLNNEIKDITPTVSHNQSSGKPTEGKD
jgi:antitoxin component of MazEF toxin-antitoxin module